MFKIRSDIKDSLEKRKHKKYLKDFNNAVVSDVVLTDCMLMPGLKFVI